MRKTDPKLMNELNAVAKSRGEDIADKYTNRLYLESSLYLLQHAHNPVNWFPWCEEAFSLARELDRPILLSVGYSTCHWCHVMAHESFEDVLIAEYLNQHYIPIKVDREQLPDVDSFYMTAVQAISGHGGWPMTVWLTPDKQPIFGGTYFPPYDGMRGQIGFYTLLKNIIHIYHNDPLKIQAASTDLQTALINTFRNEHPTAVPNRDVCEKIIAYYTTRFDEHFGGLNPAPKFPSQLSITLLLRQYAKTKDDTLLLMATRTLDHMASGGLRDHIGGGFHRYSTDVHWLVPHFEKMLYDQAQLCVAYLEAYLITGDDNYQQIVEEILLHVIRDMTSGSGAFYSAIDADSESPTGEISEGYFYTWNKSEIEQCCDDDAELLCHYYNVTEQGNFEGRNILHTSQLSFLPSIEVLKPTLLATRNQRSQPITDQKILTSWNSLMISAFAKIGFAFNRDEFIQRALRAAEFILHNHFFNQQLYRVDNTPGYLDDYTYFIAACLDLHTATQDTSWLTHAVYFSEQVEKLFADKQYGGWFISHTQHSQLLAKEKPLQDGPIPSGNAVQMLNLCKLYALTSDVKYYHRVQRALEIFGEQISTSPAAFAQSCCVVDCFYSNFKTIVILSPNEQDPVENEFVDWLRGQYLPDILIIARNEHQLSTDANTSGILHGKHCIDGQVSAYCCANGICQIPTNNLASFQDQVIKTSL